MTRTERQLVVIDKWRKAGHNGLALLPTGFGKTRVALTIVKKLIVKNPYLKVLVSVPTRQLKDQWVSNILEMNLMFNVEVEVINTIITKRHDVDFLIIDEIHLIASDRYIQIFNLVKYKILLGLTGTLSRLDGKEIEILKYCPVIDEISIQEAIKNNWLSTYTEYRVYLEVDLTEYKQACTVFMNHFDFFQYDLKNVLNLKTYYQKQEFAKTLLSIPPQHPNYQSLLKAKTSEVSARAIQLMRAMRFRTDFIANHPKKIEIARKIIEAKSQSKCVTFSSNIKTAEGIGYGKTYHSKITAKQRKQILSDYEAGKFLVLNSAKGLDQGFDAKGLKLAIILSNTSSSIQKMQRLGRVIRKEGDVSAEIYTLILKDTVEENWFKKSTKSNDYTTLNEEQLLKLLYYES